MCCFYVSTPVNLPGHEEFLKWGTAPLKVSTDYTIGVLTDASSWTELVSVWRGDVFIVMNCWRKTLSWKRDESDHFQFLSYFTVSIYHFFFTFFPSIPKGFIFGVTQYKPTLLPSFSLLSTYHASIDLTFFNSLSCTSYLPQLIISVLTWWQCSLPWTVTGCYWIVIDACSSGF